MADFLSPLQKELVSALLESGLSPESLIEAVRDLAPAREALETSQISYAVVPERNEEEQPTVHHLTEQPQIEQDVKPDPFVQNEATTSAQISSIRREPLTLVEKLLR